MVAARPIAVVLKSDRLSLATLPDALPFQLVEVDTWEEAIDRLSRFRAGCCLVDFDTHRDDVIGEIARISSSGIRLSIVACCTNMSPADIRQAIRAGCFELTGFPLDHEALSLSVQRAIEHDTNGIDSPCEVRSRLSTLTPREREIMNMFLEGANTKGIAKRLSVTKQTIDKHRKSACEKMQAPNFIRVACQLYRA
ncbi:Transcriptional regulatory protein FixJ [Stieleria varia]|uniref:Transcriptional regulatory protein FixJ n=1 Tax=Stieleria varia TaxID=2528005 RepID=A0A5C6B1V9_9BACT|nr:Transcriptional regulatory protein FixJ [Stieleria varia]